MDESNVNRLEKWFSEYECAIISAYGTRIENDTGNTWIQKDKDGNDVGKSVHDDLLFEMDDDEEGYDEEMEKRKSEKIASITKFLSSAGFSDFTSDEKSMQEVCY